MKRAHAWAVPPVLTAVLMTSGPLLARLHVVEPIVGFLTFAVAVLPGLVALFFGLFLLLRGDLPRGSVAAVIGAIPVGIVLVTLWESHDLPRINDISTNLDNPPPLALAAASAESSGQDLNYPEEFKGQVLSGYPDLISLQMPIPAEETFKLVQTVAKAQPHWTISHEDPATFSLEGSETAGIFQFTDDFAIRVLPLAGGAQIDMRSRSRVGTGDLGANAKRIRSFFAAVQDASPHGTGATQP